MQLEIEHQALAKEKDEASAARREAIERELAELRETSGAMKAQWQAEKEAIGAVREVKEQLEQARDEVERAEREADLQRAAELRYGTIPELERRAARARGTPTTARCTSSRRRSTPRTSPRPSPSGRASRCRGCSRARSRSCPHGGAPAPARHRPGRGRRGGGQRAAPLARRPPGPRSPDRHLPVPGPDRRGQDRARAGARGVHVRLAGRDGADRHERVHGEALGLAVWSVRPRATSATRRAASSPSPCAGGPTRSCCSTRSRRPTPTSSTCSCRSWTTGA